MNRKWRIAIGLCVLLIVVYFLATSGTVHRTITTVLVDPIYHKMVAEGETLFAEGETLFNEIWDDTAKELRQKSLSERQDYLVSYRADLVSASENDEDLALVDKLVDNFISEMNKREVYFE